MKARYTILALGAVLGSQTTLAQTTGDRPWYVGVTQDFTRSSNVLGTPTGEQSDTISTTSLRGGVNQLFGRQRLRADVSLNHQRYKELSERNNDGYGVGVVLDWATIERLSGSLALHSDRHQADFNVGGITPVSLSNIERSDDLEFRARLGVVTMLGFEAGVGHRQVSFSAPEFAPREYKQDRANLGVVYRPSGILSLSTGVSGAKTRYRAPEVGQTEADRNKRSDVYVAANWVPTGASTVGARLAYGKQEYDLSTVADFKGATGSLSWAWRPSGRLSVTTTLLRESGQEAGFQRLVAPDETATTAATDFARVTNRASVSATYDLTGKIDVNAGLSYARRNLVDRVSGATGRDNTTMVLLGARWAATRTIGLGCEVSRESRSGSGTGTSDLDIDRFGCSGSITFD
jgi:hypothetical protein